MESIMSSKTEKNILILVIVLSAIIVCIALYFFVVKNPKYMMMYVLSDTTNNFVTNIKDKAQVLDLFNKGIVIEGNASYLYKTNGVMTIKVPKKKNKTVTYETVVKPSVDTFSNNINFYMNKNSINSQDILKLIMPDYQREYKIYHNDGSVVLDMEDYNQFIELNKLDINADMNLSIVANSTIVMYERIFESFKKQFQNSDFYYLKDGNTYNICLSLNKEKIKKYINKTCEALLKDNAFVTAYKQCYKQICPNVIVDREFLQNKINEFIEKINTLPVDKQTVFEIVVVTDDVLGKKINEIQILTTEQNNIVGKGLITFNDNSLSINYNYNDEIFEFSMYKTELGYDILLNNAEKVNIRLMINSFGVSKNIIVSGNIEDKTITGSIKIGYVDKITYDVDVEMQAHNSINEEVANIKLDSQVIFDGVEEYIPARQMIGVSQANNDITKYINEMYDLFKPKQVAK